ncbi:MAG: hypothetical protein HFI66_09235 [Lachnospiraceae bacterium]|jgi:hypothetical protein|nr:hypothetical protein [Lachnospiraceae bacterium]
MRKYKFNSIVIILCVMLYSLPVFANSEIPEEDLAGQVTDLFIEVCTGFFETGRGTYRAIDNNGNDVTDLFYNEYIEAYNNDDFYLIHNAVERELDVITWERVTENRIGRTVLINGSASKSAYKTCKSTKTPVVSIDVVYTVSGTYKYIDSTGEIVENSPGMISIDASNVGASFSFSQTKSSTWVTKSADLRTITFNGQGYGILKYIRTITVWEQEFGPFTISATSSTK